MTSRKSNGKTTPRTSRSQRRARTASKANKTIELEATDITNQEQTEASKEAPDMATESQGPEVEKSASEAVPEVTDAKETEPEASETGRAEAVEGETSDQTASTSIDDVTQPAQSESRAEDEKEVEDISTDVEETPSGPASESPKSANGVPPVPPVSRPQNKKGGFGSGLLGGLLGGVAVVAASYVGLQQGMISLPNDNGAQAEQVAQLSSLQEALATLEGKVAAVESASVDKGGEIDLSPLEGRLGEVEGKISSINIDLAALTEKAASANDVANTVISKLAETGESSGEQSSDIASSVAAAATLALQGELEGINGKIEVYGRRLDDLEGLKERLAALRASLDGLETRVSEQASAVEARFMEAESQILAGADRRVNVLVADLSRLDGKLSDMSSQIAGEAEALAGRVASLEENNLSAKMQSSAYTIALAGLENAVASGANFKLAFDTFANVGSGNEALEALRPYAESGVPTAKQLAETFDDVYEKVLREAKDAGEATLLDKFLLNAQNLVKVRSLDGEQKGESLTSKLGVVDYHLRKGDLGKVLESWDALPEVAKDAKAAADWVAGLRGRVAADAAVDVLRASGKDAAAQGNES